MSSSPTAAPTPHPRLLELLADRAVAPLSRSEHAELDKLADLDPGFDLDCLDRAAAALAVSHFAPTAQWPPAATMSSLRAAGAAWAAAKRSESLADEFGEQPHAPLPISTPLRKPRIGWAAWTGWLAAAAAITLAIAGWWSSAPVSAERRLAALSRSGAPVLDIPWSNGPSVGDYGAPSGRVIWCPKLQEGYMVLSGLRTNDPRVEQYQLWIFDATRDDRHPIDGGVFDISVAGEVVIPIRAAVPVGEASMFAITVERPGGVVVSDRSRLPALAVVKSAG